MSDVVSLVRRDPAVQRALTALFGKADDDTVRLVLHGSNEQVIKGTMLAMPKSAKKMLAKVKPPPVPKPLTAAAAPSAPGVQGAVKPPAPKVSKALSEPSVNEQTFTVVTEIAKFDEDERTVFGWASITEMDGVPVIDRQGDMIDSVEMAKAAYEYVVGSRTGGHQHRRTETNEPLKVSDMIESVVFTPEKIAKMGLPPTTPVGWWVGYRVHDDEIWKAVKDGDITGFSIHGKGRRIPVGQR